MSPADQLLSNVSLKKSPQLAELLRFVSFRFFTMPFLGDEGAGILRFDFQRSTCCRMVEREDDKNAL